MTRRKAFTLIEILVVVAILVILIAIVGYALNRVVGNSKISATRVRMESLKSMLGELEAATKGLNRPIPNMYSVSGAPVGPQQYWRDADPSDGTTNPEPDPFPAPIGLVTLENAAEGAPPRYDAAAVLNTQQVIGLIQQVPGGKTGIQQMPASELMEPLPAGVTSRLTVGTGTPPPQYSGAANSVPNPPVPLDAWRNPIIMVPGGGLSGVHLGFKGGDVTVTTNYDQPNYTVKARDLRPFWASAGPDGRFEAGDDNIYSFEN